MQINPRFITFNSIIHENLMPWLKDNQDQEKFRLLLRKMAPIQNGESGSFFRALNSAFREMGIRAGHKLTEELNMLSQIHVTPEIEDISGTFIQTDDTCPKIIFYTSLIKHSLSAYLSQIQNTVSVNHSASFRRHGIMGLMKTISDMIIHTQSLNSESSTDRIIINRLLAGLTVLFSETKKLFPHDYDPVFIRVSNADIKIILTTTVNEDNNTETLFSSLAEKYFLMSEMKPDTAITTLPAEDQKRTVLQQNEPVSQQNPDALIFNEVLQMQEILSGLKKDVSGIKEKRKNQPDTNDRRIGSAEVCMLLHISKSTLQAHREKGLYSFTKIGSRYLYSAKEINEILRLNKGM
jgi:hypothetical protein